MRTVNDLLLSTDEFTEFSVPHTLCLAGECQYSLGLPAIVLATNLRLHVLVADADADLELVVGDQPATASAGELTARWLGILRERATDELSGVRVSLGLRDTFGLRPEVVLASPATAVGLACVLLANQDGRDAISGKEVCELAVDMLLELARPAPTHPDRFYAECLVCVEGGARHVSPSSGSLNVQLLIPSASLILAVSPEAAACPSGGAWEEVLLGALQKAGGSAELLAATEQDAGLLFDTASGALDDRETTVLYGLLRVREMIAQQVERLGRPMLDHDLLAELCDEESSGLEYYFGFPVEPYRKLRDRAIENGALGAKLTYALGAQPAMIILAPGCRNEVIGTLEAEFSGRFVLPVEVDPAGVGTGPVAALE